MKITKEEAVIEKLKEAFEPKNIECDGFGCIGCWKDIVREAIKMLEAQLKEVKSVEEIKPPEFFLTRGTGNFIHCTDYEDAIQAAHDYHNQFQPR